MTSLENVSYFPTRRATRRALTHLNSDGIATASLLSFSLL